jgi:hypothetical protein
MLEPSSCFAGAKLYRSDPSLSWIVAWRPDLRSRCPSHHKRSASIILLPIFREQIIIGPEPRLHHTAVQRGLCGRKFQAGIGQLFGTRLIGNSHAVQALYLFLYKMIR